MCLSKAYHADDAAEHDEVEQQGGEAVQHGHHRRVHGQGLLHVGAVGEPHTQVLRVEDLRTEAKGGERVRVRVRGRVKG
jgi:hypothetical protein